jgi:hypothetical protein
MLLENVRHRLDEFVFAPQDGAMHLSIFEKAQTAKLNHGLSNVFETDGGRREMRRNASLGDEAGSRSQQAIL